MPRKIINFRDLRVWQFGKEIVVDVYKVTRGFPKEEVYGLVSQMRRSAVSIPSNIAEGYNRNYKQEFERYLNISLGSCAELETQIEISFDLGYLENANKDLLLDKLNQESKMLKAFIKNLK